VAFQECNQAVNGALGKVSMGIPKCGTRRRISVGRTWAVRGQNCPRCVRRNNSARLSRGIIVLGQEGPAPLEAGRKRRFRGGLLTRYCYGIPEKKNPRWVSIGGSGQGRQGSNLRPADLESNPETGQSPVLTTGIGVQRRGSRPPSDQTGKSTRSTCPIFVSALTPRAPRKPPGAVADGGFADAHR